jgi:Zn-dependent M16 (insulinase) family peptidase
VLPSLTLSDIPRQIEFVDHNISYTRSKNNSLNRFIDVRTWWFDQPTNGITYVRVKANLKNLPEHLRVFVPMFSE